MKCLTICQPYASLIVTPQALLPVGQVQKRIENRRWSTLYRGPLLIHAGKSREWFDGYDEIFPDVPFGAIVGCVELVGCVPRVDLGFPSMVEKYPWALDHVHMSGPYCWILEDPVMFEMPIPFTGKQGLFEVDDSVIKEAGTLINADLH